MGTREYISTKRLQPGMIIDQSITDATGRVMIKRNVYLDQYQIEYLMSRGISGVYITDTLEEDGKPGIEPIKKKIIIPSAAKKVIARERVEDPTKVEMSETVKARVNEGIQYLFKNTNADNFSGAAMQVSKDLTEAIMTNSAVAIDINTLKVSDEYTFKHSVDVAMISMIIGKRHGLSRDEIREIGVAGLLHDMGKSKIPTEILNKPGKLTDEEFALMKRHPYDGYQILKESGGFSFWRWTRPDWLYRGLGPGLAFLPHVWQQSRARGVFGNPGLGSGPVFGDSRLHLPLPVLAALSSVGGGGAAESQKINILTELSICHFRESFTA